MKNTIQTNASWIERSLKSVWHPCTQMQHHESVPPIALKSGKDVWLYDHEDNRYFDAISSWWTNLFGHANPVIGQAIKDQIDTLEHVMLAGCTHEPVVNLSEKLSALTDHHLGHCFYGSDGASAVEIALKMSYHYWHNIGQTDKEEFVCLRGSYHGETIGALSVTDVPLFRQAYAGLIRQVHIVSCPDPRNANEAVSRQQIVQNAVAEVKDLFEKRATHIAAMIVEPLIQCANGFVMYDPEYLKQVRALCDQYHVHLIADEIAVGCGRSGTFLACEQAGIWPDLMCISKAITGGFLPLAVVLTTEEIYQAFYDKDVTRGFLHSHSYTGNPLACRAALAVLDIFEQQDVLRKNRENAKFMTQALSPIQAIEGVTNFRNRGMIWAFDVQMHADDLATFPRRFFNTALKHEVLMRPIGNTVYLMPPYVLDEEKMTWLADRVNTILKAVLATQQH